MNREEAIKICRALKVEADLWGEDEASEALDIAIEALKREDTMLKEIERVVLYGERSEANE